MPTHLWLDGRLVSPAEPHIYVTDRGFQLGDGLFETLRVRRGVPIEWEEHLERLRDGASVLAIPLPSAEALERGVAELLDAEGLSAAGDASLAPGDATIRITVTRGPLERRGTLPPGWEATTPTVAIQAWRYAPPPRRQLASGIRTVTSALRRDPSSPLSGIKSTSRADYVVARLEAERASADDALFLTLDGRLSEATSSNLFVVAGDRLLTPPPSAAILAGTTRTWLLRDPSVGDLGLTAEARDLWPDDLFGADEAFLSASVAGIVPLVAHDGRAIGTGRPGKRTLALRVARERWIDETSLVAPRARG